MYISSRPFLGHPSDDCISEKLGVMEKLRFLPACYHTPATQVERSFKNRTHHRFTRNYYIYCKSRIFRMHVIFVYFVRGAFCTKIKCVRKV